MRVSHLVESLKFKVSQLNRIKDTKHFLGQSCFNFDGIPVLWTTLILYRVNMRLPGKATVKKHTRKFIRSTLCSESQLMETSMSFTLDLYQYISLTK